MNTIPNEVAGAAPGKARAAATAERRGAGSLAVAMAGALLGGLILVLGIPQLVAAVVVGNSRDVVWELEAGRSVDGARLDQAIASLKAADDWAPAAERGTERGWLLTVRAGMEPPGPRREALYAEAAATIGRALAIGPVQPHAWTTLAVLRERTNDTAGAVAALRQSFLAGAFDPRLLRWRLDIAIRLMPALDRETLSLVRRQIRYIWIVDPAAVARYAEDAATGALVREALQDLDESEIAAYLLRHGKP